MYTTIAKILEMKEIDGVRLVAGDGGRANAVSNVNILDNPDTFDWLVAGDLLLTTGYIFRDDPAFQKRLVRELSERSCAGLGFKVKRFFETVPAIIIDEANRLGFPIIEIPYRYSLSDISNKVTSEVYGNMDSQLKRIISLHDTLNQVALRGGEIGELVAQIASIVQNPVILLDSRHRLIASSDAPGNPFALADRFNLVFREPVFPQAVTRAIPAGPDQLRKSIKLNLPGEDGELILRVIPVIAAQVVYGYLVVPETENKLKQVDYMALEHAATIIALDRIKAKAVEEVRHRIRRDFFDDLLANNIHSISGLGGLAEIHGLRTDRIYYCMITRIGSRNGIDASELYESLDGYTSEKDRAARIIDTLARERGMLITSISRRNLVISFIHDKANPERSQKHTSVELAQQIMSKLEETLKGIEFRIGIGKAYEVLALGKSFSEAQEALRMDAAGPHGGAPVKVVHYENYRVLNLFSGIQSQEQLLDFYHKTIGRVVEYDRENGTSLTESMEAYFRQNGNISEAAKELFIHRNTFIYRIEKLKRVLDSELRDSEELLELQLGIKIMNYLKLTGALQI